jgi:hypothetical protein
MVVTIHLFSYQSDYNSSTGTNNTFAGYKAGQNVTTGSTNIVIGPTLGTSITDGSDNVLISYDSQAEDGLYDATATGAGSHIAISNVMVLGKGVNVGIGTTAPIVLLCYVPRLRKVRNCHSAPSPQQQPLRK